MFDGAQASATAEARSLSEPVGLRESFFLERCGGPRDAPSRWAWRSGEGCQRVGAAKGIGRESEQTFVA